MLRIQLVLILTFNNLTRFRSFRNKFVNIYTIIIVDARHYRLSLQNFLFRFHIKSNNCELKARTMLINIKIIYKRSWEPLDVIYRIQCIDGAQEQTRSAEATTGFIIYYQSLMSRTHTRVPFIVMRKRNVPRNYWSTTRLTQLRALAHALGKIVVFLLA